MVINRVRVVGTLTGELHGDPQNAGATTTNVALPASVRKALLQVASLTQSEHAKIVLGNDEFPSSDWTITSSSLQRLVQQRQVQPLAAQRAVSPVFARSQ